MFHSISSPLFCLLTRKGSANKENCGEYVGRVIEKATGQQIDKKKDALPGTYALLPGFTSTYMDRYTGKDPTHKEIA